MVYWLIFALPGLILGLWAQARVKGAFNKYSKVRTMRGITGAQVARALLDEQGLSHVAIEETQGRLSDHYDPRSKVLRLSPDVYRTPSIAAAGVAAHEMGHALQDQSHYIPLKFRSALVPATQFTSRLAPMIFMAGFMLTLFTRSEFGLYIAWAGVALFAIAVIFTLVTLPVEFNASKRAKRLLVSSGILVGDEIEGVNKVLNAAALTYVAAAVTAIGQLLYYVMLLSGGRRR
ncbi:MAG: zinc metallopeptidase [Candidatus Promineifilaceae bacterium]|nr:zinc metallopeptidase [Candidatus Promineifilaceae bacterium]